MPFSEVNINRKENEVIQISELIRKKNYYFKNLVNLDFILDSKV